MAIYTLDEYNKLKASGKLQKQRQATTTPTPALQQTVATTPQPQQEYGVMPFLKGIGSGIVDTLHRSFVTPVQGVLEGIDSFTTLAQRPGGLDDNAYNSLVQSATNKKRTGEQLTNDEQKALDFEDYTLKRSGVDTKKRLDQQQTDLTFKPTFMRQSDYERYGAENPLLVGGKQALETGSWFLPAAKLGTAGVAATQTLKGAIPIAGAMSGIGSTRPNATPTEYGVNAGVGAATAYVTDKAVKGIGKLIGKLRGEKQAATVVDKSLRSTADINKIPTSTSKYGSYKLPSEAEAAEDTVQTIINKYKKNPEISKYSPKVLSGEPLIEQNYNFLGKAEGVIDKQAIEAAKNSAIQNTADDITNKWLSNVKAEDATLFTKTGKPKPILNNIIKRLNSENYLGKYKETGTLNAADQLNLRKAIDSLLEKEYNKVNVPTTPAMNSESAVYKTLRDILDSNLKGSSTVIQDGVEQTVENVPGYTQLMKESSFIKNLLSEATPGKAIKDAGKRVVGFPNTPIQINVGDAWDKTRLATANLRNAASVIPNTSGVKPIISNTLPVATAGSVVNNISKPINIKQQEQATNTVTEAPQTNTVNPETLLFNKMMSEAVQSGNVSPELLSLLETQYQSSQSSPVATNNGLTTDEQKILEDYIDIASYYDNLTGPKGGDKYTWTESQDRAFADLVKENPAQIALLNKVKSIVNGEAVSGTSGGKMLPAGQLRILADTKQAIALLPKLDQEINATIDSFGPIKGLYYSTNPYESNAQRANAAIFLVKQIIGKGLEGGVLRREDEYKYERILPRLTDTKETVKNKIDILKSILNTQYEITNSTYLQGGYDPSAGGKMTEQVQMDNYINSNQPQNSY